MRNCVKIAAVVLLMLIMVSCTTSTPKLEVPASFGTEFQDVEKYKELLK